MNRSNAHRRGVTFRDVIVLMLMLSLLSGGFLFAQQQANEAANRVKCAMNLKAIGMAMMYYAGNNRGAYPRARFNVQSAKPVSFTSFKPADPNPFAATGPGPNDVTAAMYLLITRIELQPATFICPTSNATPINLRTPGTPTGEWKQRDDDVSPEEFARRMMENNPQTAALLNAARAVAPVGQPVAERARELANFPKVENLSYSMANPYPSRDALNVGFRWNSGLGEEFALFADMNPGSNELAAAKFESMPPIMTAAMRPIPMTNVQRAANSPNHGGQGQNILFADGAVTFQQTPFAGPAREGGKRDNIYTRHFDGAPSVDAGDPIMGSPMDAKDNVLLPTAKARP